MCPHDVSPASAPPAHCYAGERSRLRQYGGYNRTDAFLAIRVSGNGRKLPEVSPVGPERVIHFSRSDRCQGMSGDSYLVTAQEEDQLVE